MRPFARGLAVGTAVVVSALLVLVVGAPVAGAGAGGTSLVSGEQLTVGQSIYSPNGYYQLKMQTDGNLVLYGPGGGPTGALWYTGTTSGAKAKLQSDGNFVVYRSNNTAAWDSGTYNHPGAWLSLQDDGNLVVYGPGPVALWWTGVAAPYRDAVVDNNIAGNHLSGTVISGSGDHFMAMLERMTLSPLPESITAQEVCGVQALGFAALLNFFAPNTYSIHFSNSFVDAQGGTANPSETCTNGYGVLVATRNNDAYNPVYPCLSG